MFILGTKISNVTQSEAIKKAEHFLVSDRQHYIVTPNPEIVLRAVRDRSYRRVLNKASLSIPDGTGIVWASGMLHKKSLPQRIAGVDFMQQFLKGLNAQAYEAKRPYRFLLLGGRGGVARDAAALFRRRFSAVSFYAIENIDTKNFEFVVREIIRPDCVFVALGAPRQEQWIAENIRRFPSIKIAMGVGGAFDMISGKTRRAPRLMRKKRMEWLWRFMLEPRRIGRILNAVVVFSVFVLKEKFLAPGS